MKPANILKMGDRIKSYRIKTGLTQTAFANKCGINPVQYRRYENNNTMPREEQLEKIAAALNVSITDLIGSDLSSLTEKGKQASKLPDSVIDSLLSITDAGKEAAESSKESLLILNYRKLNPEGKTEAVKRVEELTQIPKYKLNAVEKE